MSLAESSTESQVKIFQLLLKLGIFLYPTFYLLDVSTYPEQKFPILMVRLGVTLVLVIIYFLSRRIKKECMLGLIFSGFISGAMGISLICVLSGEGLASPYYAGVLEIIFLSMALYTLEPKRYALLVFLMVGQHFVMNLFFLFRYKDLVTNIFTLGVISIAVLLVHIIIYSITKENRQLKGLLPICSKCKRIRDEQGLWHRLDDYIHTHSSVEFTHSICPACSEQLYGRFLSKSVSPALEKLKDPT